MPVIIKELVITVKANEARQAPVSQQRPEARAQQAKQGQDALVREAVEQALQILNRKNER
ncbi:DUF5908 family protein [Neolewinella persica]|uniref:DUF5908 family protein n=1 Tax=Neolewinella persica TaxID=70998 RepID=UPI00035C0ECC|nr:DUF5908 family protein [Neolewinella persica]